MLGADAIDLALAVLSVAIALGVGVAAVAVPRLFVLRDRRAKRLASIEDSIDDVASELDLLRQLLTDIVHGLRANGISIPARAYVPHRRRDERTGAD